MRTKLLVKWLAISAGVLSVTGFADRTSTYLDLKTKFNPVSIADSASVISQSTRSEAEIWSLLQQGTGYVVLIRHALAPGTGDPSNFQLDDCSTQRNLSDTGREQAVRIGEAFKSRQIPIDQVLSSQWCRCLETARLMDVGSKENKQWIWLALDAKTKEIIGVHLDVGSKENKQWIWLALDAKTKEIVGVHLGDRSREGARKLWQSLPGIYRQCAVCYSDFWEAYEQVIPSKRHRAVGKETGKTN